MITIKTCTTLADGSDAYVTITAPASAVHVADCEAFEVGKKAAAWRTSQGLVYATGKVPGWRKPRSRARHLKINATASHHTARTSAGHVRTVNKALLLQCLYRDTDHLVCDVEYACDLLRGYDQHTSGFMHICIIRTSGKSEGWRRNAHLDGYWMRAGGTELLTTHCLLNRIYRAKTITAVEIWPG